MQLKGLLEDRTPYRKFLVLVGLTLLGAIIGTLIGSILGSVIYGFDFSENSNVLSDLSNPNLPNVLKIIQLFSALGTFVFPPILAAILFSKAPKEYLGLERKPAIPIQLLIIALMFAMVPFINWMMQVNAGMKLPESLKSLETWMKNAEMSATQITELFLKTTSLAGLITNLLIIAILPAIGEELLFRGVIQKLFKDLSGNVHVGIILAAALFSAMHMQFYGFIPRFALGIMLGYLMLWSGNLWIPIIAHFINNGTAVVFAWFASRQGLPFNQDTLGTEPGQELVLAISVFLTWGMLFLIKKNLIEARKFS